MYPIFGPLMCYSHKIRRSRCFYRTIVAVFGSYLNVCDGTSGDYIFACDN